MKCGSHWLLFFSARTDLVKKWIFFFFCFQATYLEHFEGPRQGRRLGGPQREEDVEQRLPVVLLEHYLLAGLRSLGCRGCRFPLLARVLDQALTPAEEPLGLDKSASQTLVAAGLLSSARLARTSGAMLQKR